MTKQDELRALPKWPIQSKAKSQLQKELLASLCDGKNVRAAQIVQRLDALCHSSDFRWRMKRVAVQVMVHRGRSEQVLNMLRSVLGEKATDLAFDSYDRHFGDIDAELARFAETPSPRVQVLDRQPSRGGFARR